MNTDKEKSMEATRATTATVTMPTGGRRFPATMVVQSKNGEGHRPPLHDPSSDATSWKPRVAEMLLGCAAEWDAAAVEHRRQAALAMVAGRPDLAAMHHYAAQHDEMYAAEDRRRAEELRAGMTKP